MALASLSQAGLLDYSSHATSYSSNIGHGYAAAPHAYAAAPVYAKVAAPVYAKAHQAEDYYVSKRIICNILVL